jgi:hypothetical protein
MTTSAPAQKVRLDDQADLSSMSCWSGTAAERQKTFAELRAERPEATEFCDNRLQD